MIIEKINQDSKTHCEMCNKSLENVYRIDAWKALCYSCWRCEAQEYIDQDKDERTMYKYVRDE